MINKLTNELPANGNVSIPLLSDLDGPLSRSLNIPFINIRQSAQEKIYTEDPRGQEKAGVSKKINEIKADGACFFRGYLAALEKNPDWLKKNDLEDVYNWIGQNQEHFVDSVKEGIKFAFNISLAERRSVELADAILTDETFATDFIIFCMNQENFLLWRTEALQSFIQSRMGYCIASDCAEDIIEAIFQSISENFNIPINTNSAVFLQRSEWDMEPASFESNTSMSLNRGFHYNLITPADYFNVPKSAQAQTEPSEQDKKNNSDGCNLKSKYKILVEKIPSSPDLRLFKTDPENKESSKYRAYLALVSSQQAWLSGDYTSDQEVADYLHGKKSDGKNSPIRSSFDKKLNSALEHSFKYLNIPLPKNFNFSAFSEAILSDYFPSGIFEFERIFSSLFNQNDYSLSQTNWKRVASHMEHFIVKAMNLNLYHEEELESIDGRLTEYLVEDSNGCVSFVGIKQHFPVPTSVLLDKEEKPYISKQQAIAAGISLFSMGLNTFNQTLAEQCNLNLHPQARGPRQEREPSSQAGDTSLRFQNDLGNERQQETALKADPWFFQPWLDSLMHYVSPEKKSESSGKTKGWFEFPGGDAAPIPRKADKNAQETTPEEYEKQTSLEDQPDATENKGARRQKRRAPGDADPLDYMSLDIEKAFHHSPEIKVDNAKFNPLIAAIKKELPNFASTDGDMARFLAVAKQVNSVRRDQIVDVFMRDALDMFVMRLLDTSVDTRDAMSFYHERMKEEIVENHRVYVDTDLEGFYHDTVSHGFKNPEVAIQNRIDMMMAKILISQYDGIPLDPAQVGLAWGEISTLRQILSLQEERPYMAEISTLHSASKRDQRPVFHSVDRALKGASSLSGIEFRPAFRPFSNLLSDGAPVSLKGVGACNVLAVSAAYQLDMGEGATDMGGIRIIGNKDDPGRYYSNVLALKTVLEHGGDLDQLTRRDPAAAHRLVEGLTRINEDLQSGILGLAQYKLRGNIPDISAKINAKMRPLVITLRDEYGGNPHTISISRIVAPRGDPKLFTTTYLMVDSNLGYIPCVTPREAISAFKVAINRFYGLAPNGEDFTRVKMSYYELSKGVRYILDHANYNVLRQGGETPDIFSFRHIFSANGPGWDLLAHQHAASQHKSWESILPNRLGKLPVEEPGRIVRSALKTYDDDLSAKVLTPKTDYYLSRLKDLIQEPGLKCVKGTCSVDIKDYSVDTDPTTVKKQRGIEHLLELRLPNREPIETDTIYAKIRPKAETEIPSLTSKLRAAYAPRPIPDLPEQFSREDVPPFPPARKDAPPPPPPRGDAPPPPPPRVDAPPPPPPRGDAPQLPPARKNAPPPPPPRGDAPPPPPARPDVPKPKITFSKPNEASASDNPSVYLTQTMKAAGALVDSELTHHGQGQAPLPDDLMIVEAIAGKKIAEAIRRNPKPQEGRPSYLKKPSFRRSFKPGDARKKMEIPDPMRSRSPIFKPNPDVIPKRTIANAGGLLEGASAVDKALQLDGATGVTDEGVGGRETKFNRKAIKRAKSPNPPRVDTPERVFQDFEYGAIRKNEWHKFSLQDEGGTSLRQRMGIDLEAMQVGMHRLKSLAQNIEAVIRKGLQKEGLNAYDWNLHSTKSNKGKVVLTFIKKKLNNFDASSLRTVSIELPEKFNARLNELKMRISSIFDNRKLPSLKSIISSSGYRRLGRLTGMAGKGMLAWNLYNLGQDISELENMQPIHKLAFGLGATDLAVDLSALAVGSVNKLYKIANAGTAFPALQSASRILNKASGALGIGVSAGMCFVHMYALGYAESEFEKKIAGTNLAFSSASLGLSAIALAFPPAAPIIFALGIILSGIQAAVIQALINAEKRRLAGKHMQDMFRLTDEVLEILDIIGTILEEEVSVSGNGDDLVVVLTPKAASSKIEITKKGVTLFHATDAYQASANINKLAPGKKSFIPIIKLCSPGVSCSVNVPSLYRDTLKIASGYAPDNKALRVDDTIWPNPTDRREKKFIEHSYTFEEKKLHSNSLIPGLILNVKEHEPQYNQRLKSYLKRTYSFDTEAGTDTKNKKKVFILKEVTPTVEFISDPGAHIDDEYRIKHHPWFHRLKAITTGARERATKHRSEFYEACDEVRAEIGKQRKDVCPAEEYGWKTRAEAYFYPQVPESSKSFDQSEASKARRASPRKVIIGDSALLESPNESFALSGHYVTLRNVHPVEELSTSLPFTDVVLKPKEQTTSLDIDSLDEVIIYPEQHSFDLVTRRIENYLISAKDKDKIQKNAVFRIHPDTYKHVKEVTPFNIDLNLKEINRFSFSVGAKVNINEIYKPDTETSENNEDPENSPPLNERYLLSFISSPLSPHERKKIINDLKSKVEKERKIINNHQHRLNTNLAHLEIAKNDYVDHARMNPLGDTSGDLHTFVDKIKKLDDERNKMIMEHQKSVSFISSYEARYKGEKEFPHANTDQLRLTLKYEKRGAESILTIISSPNEPKNLAYHEKNGTPLGKSLLDTVIKIKGKRAEVPIDIIQNEVIVVDGKKVSLNCFFRIESEKDTPSNVRLKLNGITDIPDDIINKPAFIKTLIKQLKKNNPQFEPEENMILGTLKVSDKKLLGSFDMSNGTESPVSTDPADYTGQMMVYGLNTENPIPVSIIYPKTKLESPDEMAIINNLSFVGSETLLKEEVPPELLPLFNKVSPEMRKVHYLYDPNSGVLLKQYMNAAIRFHSDLTQCGPDQTPVRFSKENGSASHVCASPEYIDLSTTLSNCLDAASSSACSNIFDYIEEKQNSNQLPPLVKINNPGVKEENGQEKRPLYMDYIGGEEPHLLLIENTSPLGNPEIILRNSENDYALIGEKIPTLNEEDKDKLKTINERRKAVGLSDISEIKVSAVPILKKQEIEKLGKELVSMGTDEINKSGIPREYIKEVKEVSEGGHIISVRDDTRGGLVFQTLEGVAFRLSESLEDSRLVACNADYLHSTGVNTQDIPQLKEAYQRLTLKYGAPSNNAAFLRMSDGVQATTKTPAQPMIFMDTFDNTPLFIPRTNETSYRTVMVGGLKNQSQTTVQLTTIDPESQSINSIHHPTDLKKVEQVSSLACDYISIQKNQAYLTLRNEKDKEETELPYLPVTQLYLLPQIVEDEDDKVTSLEISQIMQDQLKTITLLQASPLEYEDSSIGERTQTINLNASFDLDQIKAYVLEDEIPTEEDEDKKGNSATASPITRTAPKFEKKNIYFAIPKAPKAKTLRFTQMTSDELSKNNLLINCLDAFENGELKESVKDTIKINGVPIPFETLKTLSKNAKTIQADLLLDLETLNATSESDA